MNALLLAVTALLAQGPFEVDIVRPPGAPTVLVHRQSGPLVTLRLSAPVDPGVPAGAVELLQELARPEARAEADRWGARLDFRHDAGSTVLSITGPAAAFDALAGIMRRAVTEADLDVTALRRARARAEDRVLADLEQPGPRLRRLLWHAVYGGDPPGGVPGTRLTPQAVRRLRARLYDPDRLRMVVVGDIPAPVLRSAFSGWSSGAVEAGGPGAAPGETGGDTAVARVQTHREWAGLAYRVDADPAVLAVVAALLEEGLEATPLVHGTVRTWHGPGGWALAVVAAAEPDGGAAAGESPRPTDRPDAEGAGTAEAAPVERAVRRVLADALAGAGPATVGRAADRVRRALLLEARTPAGKAEVIGRAADALGDPRAARRLMEALDRVDGGAVGAVLRSLLASPAAYREAG